MKTMLPRLALLALTLSSSLSGVQLSVSPEGEIATLPAARDAVRALRSAGEKGDIDVLVHEGSYRLEETLVFGLEDAAPADAVTRYRAAPGARPLVSGGRVIENWVQSPLQGGKVWMAKVPWAKGEAFFHCLFDGNELLPRAQSEPFAVSVDANRRKYAGDLEDRISFSYEGEVLKPWENLEDLELYGQPTRKWLVNFLGIASVDPKRKTAKLSVPATYNLFGDWVVENCVDHLDTPGEWALDSRQGVLYYWPKSGKPGNQVVAPALNELVRVEGVNDPSASGDEDQPVRGIVFEGLRFAHADRQEWLAEDQGIQHDWNMWDKANGLLRFRGAEDCVVRDCVFSDSGSDGVRLDLYCQNITIEGSTFRDLGGTGVLLSGYGPGRKDVNKNNVVFDNEITRVGRLFLHSPGIFVWQSGHNRISRNHIYDQAYTGLVVSGVRRRFFAPLFEEMGVKNPYTQWMFPEGTREHLPTIRWDEVSLSSVEDWSAYEPYMHARGNIIEFNEIHDCLKLLHDGNCIYLSANGDGNIVRYNVTYNHPQGAMIRTDDDSHGATVSHNLLFGTLGDSGIAIKGLNTAQHNIYINCLKLTGGAGNTVDPDADLSRNVFYYTSSASPQTFHRRLSKVKGGLDYNLYYHEQGGAEAILQAQREQSQTGLADRHSVAADPLFVDLAHGDFSFRDGSPAIGLGIEPLSRDALRKVGTTRDPFLERFAEGMPLQVHGESAGKEDAD